MNRPNVRQVLDCASPLALWADASSAKAVEGHRSPRRCRANASFLQFKALVCDFAIMEAFSKK
jgi:hypothetical protein